MRILLIQPPIQDFYETDVRLQPIGLCYLKAALRAHTNDVDVTIRDYHASGGRRTVPIPKPLQFLRNYYPVKDQSPFCAFFEYFHFGLDYDEIVDDVCTHQPDLIGISALFTPYHQEAFELARRIKQKLSSPIVFGGAHVSAEPTQVLGKPFVDYVVTGEGERPLVELVEHLKGLRPIENVSNCGYKDAAGNLRFTRPSDNYEIADLPVPCLSDLPLERYTLAGKPLCFMITSRSCPHRCSFCSVHTTFGTRFRRRPIDQVFAEIELRYSQGYRVIDFEDDNLTFYKNEFKLLCKKLIARFPNREMEFVAMNGISFISLDDELLELMHAAGFNQLNLALVTSDKTVRETTKRPHTIEAYLQVVDKAFSLKIHVVSYQILGLPSESLASMTQTMAFNARLPVLLGVSPFYITPRSPIAVGIDFSQADFMLSRTATMGQNKTPSERDAIYTLFITARIINFLKGLNPPDDCALVTLITKDPTDQRERIGFELLRVLGETGQLHFSTKRGLVANTQFDTALFNQVLEQTGQVRCLNGQFIEVASAQSLNASRPFSLPQHQAIPLTAVVVN